MADADPPEVPAPPPWPGVGPGFPVVLVNDPERFGPAAGKAAVIRELTPWGAVCSTGWGTGEIRVRFDDVTPGITAPALPPASSANGHAKKPDRSKHAARDQGYTGDECSHCGSMKMRRNGACLLCDACGTTSGCS